jgi:putative hydrolase of the HAD superfamily
MFGGCPRTTASMTCEPKAVLFDLDGTLFDRDASFLELLSAQYQTFAVSLEPIPRDVFIQRIVELDEHGYVEKTVVYREIVSEFGLPQTLAGRLNAHFQDAYGSFSRCFPEVPSALAALRTDGLQLGIITNGSSRMQEQKIRQLGIADLVDEVLISEREGLRKPDPQIFERALARLRVEAAEPWYVGDHPIVDVRGAFHAGLTPLWRYTSYWGPPDVPCRQINGIDELVEILR